MLGGTAAGDFSDKARQFRLMFTSEGIAMGLLIITGIVLLYRSILRENRLRREQERFLTGATHELKTPLATLRLGLESLQAERVPARRVPDYLAKMVAEVTRLELEVAAQSGLSLYFPPDAVEGVLDRRHNALLNALLAASSYLLPCAFALALTLAARLPSFRH